MLEEQRWREEGEKGGGDQPKMILIGQKLKLLLSWSVMFTQPQGAAELDQNQDQVLHLQPHPPSTYYQPHLATQRAGRESAAPGRTRRSRSRIGPVFKSELLEQSDFLSFTAACSRRSALITASAGTNINLRKKVTWIFGFDAKLSCEEPKVSPAILNFKHSRNTSATL